ncbi:MAG: type I-E CRISPR-associated protein Cas7/Cse4/CasC [Pontibacterium sp.]
MNRFIQLHILTSYPPANLNRDDLGRPKTAKMGGVDRLRVSSQSLKRHWRTSELFQQALAGNIGTRTKMVGRNVYDQLIAGGVGEKDAKSWAQEIAGQFGKVKKPKTKDEANPFEDLEIEQLVHLSGEELAKVDALAATLIAEKRKPNNDELQLLRHATSAVDIALFGRMLASKTQYNIEAACQVAHALTVHPVVIEDDYFTAVDDLSQDYKEDAGSSHIGETAFAAGLFYSYVCIDREHLITNLNGDEALANRAIAALVESAVKVPPSGKQNSFAHQSYASYALAEVGDQQPRSLATAYLHAVDVERSFNKPDYLLEAISKLETQKQRFDQAYGSCADKSYSLNVNQQQGTLAELIAFITPQAS